MERSPELRDIIECGFQAVVRGDASWVARHISQQARLVGTDPDEVLEGPQVADFLKQEVQAMGGTVNISPGETEAFREGSVGWGLARPLITLPNGKSFSPRWSAVFHQENGEWRVVQVHASVGVPNEELLG